MSSLLPRSLSAQDVGCAAGYQFYDCAVSGFVGCCSIDPCRLANACPVENRPVFSTSSNAPPAPTPRPYSTNAAVFTNLSTSRTVTVVIPTTPLPSPTTTTATVSAIFSQPPSSSPSSSSSSSSKQINPVGLIVGLSVGFTVLAMMIALVIYLLWRRRKAKDTCDEEPSLLPTRNLRATAIYLPQKRSNSLILASPNMDKPQPPVPASPRPWRESFADAGLSDRARNGNPPRIANTAAPAPTIWRHGRGTAALGRARASSEEAKAKGSRERSPAGGQGAQPLSRSASPVDSIFDVPRRRTTLELDASWAIFREGPAAFHGLSAPPRSRDGSRPGSNGNQGG
ncbi:hypothetical protein Daus18300_001947 [Diaporthe australafricana]|uniref:Uncharacterized protein n=1 Tax=Diaporthe australafricana TaxID=127596 RepID=A0ABR3XRP1_9PEZI